MEESIKDVNTKSTNQSILKATIKLMRPQQYYKNVLVLIGLFFSGNLFYFELLIPMVLSFFVLCLISSVNYIINDIRDFEKDKSHPEKKNRPIASGRISKTFATVLALILLTLSITLIILIPEFSSLNSIPLVGDTSLQSATIHIHSKTAFFLVVSAIFITSQFYSLFLKKIVFADIIAIAMNYVWRAIAGAVIISVFVSPWLIALSFLVALLLGLAKRQGDLALLGETAKEHKEVFEYYTSRLLDQSVAVVSAITVLAIYIYLINTFPDETVFIILAIPFVFFIMFRYLFLISSNSVAVRKAEKLFLDKQLLFIGGLLGVLFLISIYFPGFLDNLIGLQDRPI